MSGVRNICCFLLISAGLALSVGGCSSNPSYLKPEAIAEEKKKSRELFIDSEVIKLYPKKESKLGIAFDLSRIPPQAKIKKALLRMGIRKKTILARSIGDANPAELSKILIPTSFYGSSIHDPSVGYCYVVNSNITYETGNLSVLERLGGTGGKASYVSKHSGFDEWDVTQPVQNNLKKNKPFTFRLGVVPINLVDKTIFSNSYQIVEFVPEKLPGTKHFTELTIYYE